MESPSVQIPIYLPHRINIFPPNNSLISPRPSPTTTSPISSHSLIGQMAANVAAPSAVLGLGSATLSSPKRSTLLVSEFVRSPVMARNPLSIARASGGKYTCFERNWLRTDFNVIGFGLIGWLAPSSIPAIDGKSLTGLFFESIGTELAHFPTGPGVTSSFWLWMVTWHLGLFICLTFGQIGFKGRTEDYF